MIRSSIYTIGHSNLQIDHFVSLLRSNGITALADVRSHPYSRFSPQFSRDALKASLRGQGISYVFLGKELGARSSNPACYEHGHVQYARLANEPLFAEGIRRIIQGIKEHTVALMCAEKDPLDCHRALLVARKLFEDGTPIQHILSDGTTESHEEMESRLLDVCGLPEGDMFKPRKAFIEDAYKIQERKVAYYDNEMAELTGMSNV